MTIDIPDELIALAVRSAVNDGFRNEYGRGGEGREAINKEVLRQLRNLSVAEQVTAEITRQLPGVVAAVVGEQLSRIVKDEIKRQRRVGVVEKVAAGTFTLFEETSDG